MFYRKKPVLCAYPSNKAENVSSDAAFVSTYCPESIVADHVSAPVAVSTSTVPAR